MEITALKNLFLYIYKDIYDHSSIYFYFNLLNRNCFYLTPSECKKDQIEIIKIANEYSYISTDIIQKSTNWTNLRINRMLDYLVEIKRFRKETSYLNGDCFFIQNN